MLDIELETLTAPKNLLRGGSGPHLLHPIPVNSLPGTAGKWKPTLPEHQGFSTQPNFTLVFTRKKMYKYYTACVVVPMHLVYLYPTLNGPRRFPNTGASPLNPISRGFFLLLYFIFFSLVLFIYIFFLHNLTFI